MSSTHEMTNATFGTFNACLHGLNILIGGSRSFSPLLLLQTRKECSKKAASKRSRTISKIYESHTTAGCRFCQQRVAFYFIIDLLPFPDRGPLIDGGSFRICLSDPFRSVALCLSDISRSLHLLYHNRQLLLPRNSLFKFRISGIPFSVGCLKTTHRIILRLRLKYRYCT